MEKKSSKPDISDDDVYEAMKEIEGYLDITPEDFKEIYYLAYAHATERISRSVLARDIMTRDVVIADGDTPLQKVAEVMARRRISGVPVVEGDKVVGIISEKDFLNHIGPKGQKTFMGVVAECLKGGKCLAATIRVQRARDIMSTPVVTVGEDASLHDISSIFEEKGINRVPVISREGRLLGIVARADMVRSSLIKLEP
ncbi:MAG: CBS domain-containing protein [Candidatus Hydrothermarchaeaceae archaeon]